MVKPWHESNVDISRADTERLVRDVEAVDWVVGVCFVLAIGGILAFVGNAFGWWRFDTSFLAVIGAADLLIVVGVMAKHQERKFVRRLEAVGLSKHAATALVKHLDATNTQLAVQNRFPDRKVIAEVRRAVLVDNLHAELAGENA